MAGLQLWLSQWKLLKMCDLQLHFSAMYGIFVVRRIRKRTWRRDRQLANRRFSIQREQENHSMAERQDTARCPQLHHGQPVRGLQEEGIRGLILVELVQGLLLWRFAGELVQGLVFGITDDLVLLGRQRRVEFFQRLILGQLSR